MDKNKDGFITKGELKLAKKNIGMKVSDYTLINHDAYIMNISLQKKKNQSFRYMYLNCRRLIK